MQDNIDILRTHGVDTTKHLNVHYNKLDQSDTNNDLSIPPFPLYYMFDHLLNKDMGSEIDPLNQLCHDIKANELFNILVLDLDPEPTDNLHSSGIEGHASVMYRFTRNGKFYLYYSNSGLGVSVNHPCYTSTPSDKYMVCPKILLFPDERVRAKFINLLKNFIDMTYSFRVGTRTQDELSFYHKSYGRLFDSIYPVIQDIADNNCATIDMQNLYYALINYFIYLFSRQVDISEVSFDDVITGKKNPEYQDVINNLHKNMPLTTNFETFYENAKKGNDEIYGLLSQIDIKKEKSVNQLISLIEKIHNSLDGYGKLDSTIAFRKKNFDLEYKPNWGIANNSQSAGSCVFYSRYNLMISMKLLQVYDMINEDGKTIDEAVKEFVGAYLTFHYQMLNILAMTIDKKKVNELLINEVKSENNITIVLRIINMLKENNLMDEMNKLYTPSDQQNANFFEINDLLKIPIKATLTARMKLRDLDSTDYYADLENYLVETINQIRNSPTSVDKMDIKKNLTGHFSAIKRKITRSPLYSNTDSPNSVYYDTMNEIYYIYINILIKIYQNPREYKVDITLPTDHVDGYLMDFNDTYESKNVCDQINSDKIKAYDIKNATRLIYLLYPHELSIICYFIENVFSQNLKSVSLSKSDEVSSIEYILRILRLQPRDFKNCGNIGLYDIKIPENKHSNIYNCTLSKAVLIKNPDIFDLFYHRYIQNIKHAKEEDKGKYRSALVNLAKSVQMTMRLPSNFDMINTNIDQITAIISCGACCVVPHKSVHNDSKNLHRNTRLMNYLLNDREKKTNLYVLSSLMDTEFIINNIINKLCSDESYIGRDCIDLFQTFDDHVVKALKYHGYTYESDSKITKKHDNKVPDGKEHDRRKHDMKEHDMKDHDMKDHDGILHEYLMTNISHEQFAGPYNLMYLLFRFGISMKDNGHYIMLVSKSLIDDSDSNVPTKDIRDSNASGYISFIFFNHNKRIDIRIKDNLFNNLWIDDRIVEINMNNHLPVMKTLPLNAPLMQYMINDTYYIDCILTCAFQKDTADKSLYKKILKHTDVPSKETDFNIITIKVGPSMLFWDLSSFNHESYNMINDNYETVSPGKINILIKEKIPPNEIKYENLNAIKECIDQMMQIDENLFDQYSQTMQSKFNEAKDDEKDARDTQAEKLKDAEMKENMEKTLDGFLKEYRLCGPRDDQKAFDRKCINKSVELWKRYKSDVLGSLQNKTSTNEFIYENIIPFIKLMEINVVLGILGDLTDDKNCWELQKYMTKIDDIIYFNLMMSAGKFYLYELIFLLQNNYFYSRKQLIKYFSIRKELVAKKSDLKVHQFMMGRGKTSVFTPLLAFGVHVHHGKQPTVITSAHLVKDTERYMSLMEVYTDIKVIVLSDENAKNRWLENTDIRFRNKVDGSFKINIGDGYNIIDEFDSHHTSFSSVFNKILDADDVDGNILLHTYLYLLEKERYDKKWENAKIFYDGLDQVIKQTETMIYNKNYGFGRSINSRIAIPFLRKDTPMIGSNFSNILLTIVLTFKIYIDKYKNNLTPDDVRYIVKNENMLENMDNILESVRGIVYFQSIDPKEIQSFRNILDEIANSTQEIDEQIAKACTQITELGMMIKQLITYHFIKTINHEKIKISTRQLNMSFQDIIYNVYPDVWQVGYSGTTNLDLTTAKSEEEFVFKQIIGDPEEDIEIKLALLQYGTKIERDPIRYIDVGEEVDASGILGEIVGILKDQRQIPRGIVDLAGIFIDYDNRMIAEKLKEIEEIEGMTEVIYLDKHDKAIIYGESKKFETPTETCFYYYDQGHTVGTDILQPQTGHFGVIVSDTTRMTDFAQAIFRFRKLNRGTYMTVFIINKTKNEEKSEAPPPQTISQFYKKLKHNDEEFKKSQKDGLSFQLMKTMVRKKDRNYEETNLKPEFMSNPDDTDSNGLIARLRQNTVGLGGIIDKLDETKDDNDSKEVKKIYDQLVKNIDQLRTVLLGRGGDVEREMETDAKKEIVVESSRISKDTTFIDRFVTDPKYACLIIHNKCERCKNDASINLFNDVLHDDAYKINGKVVRISYNFLSFDRKYMGKYEYADEGIENIYPESHKIPDKWCFIEFDDFILIETEHIAVNAYYKLPVYDYLGNLINPYNDRKSAIDAKSSTVVKPATDAKSATVVKPATDAKSATVVKPATVVQLKDKLIFSDNIKKMFAMKGSVTIRTVNMDEVISKLNPRSKILLKFIKMIESQNRYTMSTKLIDSLDKLNIDEPDEPVAKQVAEPTEEQDGELTDAQFEEFLKQSSDKKSDDSAINHNSTDTIIPFKTNFGRSMYGCKVVNTKGIGLIPLTTVRDSTGGGHNTRDAIIGNYKKTIIKNKLLFAKMYIRNKNNYIYLYNIHKK